MGSRIACHFAGVGIRYYCLILLPKNSAMLKKAKGLSLDHPAVKNRIVNEALTAAVKSNPSPVYTKEVVNKIKTGQFYR